MGDEFTQSAILSNNLSNLARGHDELRNDFRAYVTKSDERFTQLLGYTNKLLAFQIAQFFIFALVIVTMFFYFSAAVSAVASISPGVGK